LKPFLLCLVLVGTAQAQGQLVGSLDSGRWTRATVGERLDGWRLGAAWSWGAWRVAGGAQTLSAGDGLDRYLSALVGLRPHPWIDGAVGGAVAWTPAARPALAGSLRLGPAVLGLVATLREPSPATLALPKRSVGLDAQLGGGRVWLGVGQDVHEALAAGAAGSVPLSASLSLRVGALLQTDAPGEYLRIQAGLAYTLE
jgi:hypothetical protein